MQNVLVYQSGWDPDAWTATDWPTQTNAITGGSAEHAQDNYIDALEANRDNIRFFGPILTTCNLINTGNTWQAIAYADRPYSTIQDTEEEAKAAFIELWNNEYVSVHGGDPITDSNVDWNYE